MKSNRGKYAEGKVRQFLKDVAAQRSDFIFDRISDARSAKGRTSVRRPADFVGYMPGHHIWIEVKEVNHERLLPQKNLHQVPLLRLRKAAGGTVIIPVYFTPLKQWRLPPFEFFVANTTGKGSFDLEKFPLFKTVGEAITTEFPKLFR